MGIGPGGHFLTDLLDLACPDERSESARARALLGAIRPHEPDTELRHPDAVAVAPASIRTALAGTLDSLAQARRQRGVAQRAAGVLDLLRPLLTTRYPDHPARLADLDRLVGAAAQSATLAEYVTSLTLDPPASTSDYAGAPHLDEDYLTLSTVHCAKGLEWDSVHIIHAVDGAFPSDMALSTPAGLVEEQRLFYVAATRARDELAIYTPLRMPHHRRAHDDKHSYAPASRFLDERPSLRSTSVRTGAPLLPIAHQRTSPAWRCQPSTTSGPDPCA